MARSTTASERDIVIIGGGIIGVTTAYYLTRHPSYDPQRHRITIVEASRIAGGASGKAGGLLALWAYPSCLVPLSFRLHAELAREHDGEQRWGYRRIHTGQLTAKGRLSAEATRVAKGSQDKLPSEKLPKRSSDALALLRSAGVPSDLDWFRPDSVISYDAMGDPSNTAQVHPYQFTTAMAALAEEKGARIIHGRVTSIKQSKDRVQAITYSDATTAQSQTLPATDVVIAAGPWSRRVYPPAPVAAVRAHSVTIRPSRPVSAYAIFTEIAFQGAGRARTKDVSPEIYARPNNEIYACGEGDRTVPLPDTTADVETDPRRCQDIIDHVSSISEELNDGEILVRQACYLPNVEGAASGPLIGPTRVAGLWIAAGHTCWGIQNGPGTGKLMSEFIFDGAAQSAKIGSLDPRKVM